jgi:GH24 family phage-related lysozyme (muramidase)
VGIKASEQIINKIKEFEGFSATPYLDAKTGKYAVGYGDTKDSATPVTKKDADLRLRKWMQTAEQELGSVIKRQDLPQNRQDVLIDMHYNLGLTGMKGIIDRVNSGDDEGVGKAILEYVNTTDAATGKKFQLDSLKKRAAYRAQLWNSAEVISPNPFDRPSTQADSAPGAFVAGDDFDIDLDSIVNEVAPQQAQPSNAPVVDDYFIAEMDDVVNDVLTNKDQPAESAKPQDTKSVLDAASDATFRESSSQWLMRRSEAERISKKLGIGLLEARDLLADSSAEDILARNANGLTAQYFPAVSQWAKNPDNYVMMKKTGELPHRIELKTKALNTDSNFVKALRSNEITLKRYATHFQMLYGGLDTNSGKRALFELDQKAKEFRPVKDFAARKKIETYWNSGEQGVRKIMQGEVLQGAYESLSNYLSAIASYAGDPDEYMEEIVSSASSFAPSALTITGGILASTGAGATAGATLVVGGTGLSLLLSFGSRMDEQLQEFRRPDGSIDYDRAFSDPERVATWRAQSAIYSGAMSVSDFLLGGVAGKIAAKGAGVIPKIQKIATASVIEEGGSEFTASTAADAYVGKGIENLPKNITAAVREATVSPGFIATGSAIANGSVLTAEYAKKGANKMLSNIKKSAAAKDRAETLKGIRQEILKSDDAKQNKTIVQDLIVEAGSDKSRSPEIYNDETDTVSDKEIAEKEKIDQEGIVLFTPSEFNEFVTSKGFDPQIVIQNLSPEVQDQYIKNKESDSSVSVTIDEWLTFQTDDAIEGIDDIARFPDIGINAKEAAEIADDVFTNPMSFLQSAYHGSPYRFDKFSTAAIGTGEGAQAFGYGLYFTEDRDIAEWYREKLTEYSKTFTKDGKTLNTGGLALPIEALKEYYTPGQIVPGYASNQKVLQFIDGDEEGWYVETISVDAQGNEIPGERPRTHFTTPDSRTFKKVMESRGWQTDKGQTYEVEIPEKEQMLDWEETYSKQSEYVKDRLDSVMKQIYKTDPEVKWKSGKSFYKAISNQLGSDKKASNFLKSKGIFGIQYSAQGGKSDKKNFVIFEDRDVEIVRSFYQTSEEDLPPPVPGQEPSDVVAEPIEPMQIIEPSQAEGNIVMRPVQLLSKFRNKKEQRLMTQILAGLKRATKLTGEIPKESLDAIAEIQYSHLRFRAEVLGMRPEELMTMQFGVLTAAEKARKKLKENTIGVFTYDITTERLPYGLTKLLIDPNADLSTVTHELGHSWLHDMARDSEFIFAIPEEQLTDRQREYKTAMQDTAELFELGNISDILNLPKEQQTRIHETFAQTAEKYFYEGKFENNKFRQVLEHFRQFLKRIAMSIGNAYKQYPPFKINPKIERIFETILGASDKIENTLYPMFPEPMFDANMLGADGAKYLETQQEARSRAIGDTYTKAFIKSEKERETEALARLEEFRVKAENEVDAQPTFLVLKYFKDNYAQYVEGGKQGTDPRLSFNSIARVFFGGDVEGASAFRQRVPFQVMASKGKGGIEVDQFMADNNINDYTELMTAMIEMSQRDELINDLVNQQIDAEIPLLKTDDEIHKIAEKAVQNKGKEKLMQLEMKILAEKYLPTLKGVASKLINPARYTGKDSKEQIERLATSKIMQSAAYKFSPKRFLIDSDRKGKSAAKNFKSNDIVSALEDKYQQMVNFKAFETAEKVYSVFVKMDKDLRKIVKYAGKKAAANRYDLDLLNQGKRIIMESESGKISPIAIDFISDASAIDPSMVKMINDLINRYNDLSYGGPRIKNNVAAALSFGNLMNGILKASSAAARLKKDLKDADRNEMGDAVASEVSQYAGTLDLKEGRLKDTLNIRWLMESLIGRKDYYKSQMFKIISDVTTSESKSSVRKKKTKIRIQDVLKPIYKNNPGLEAVFNPIGKRLPEFAQKALGILPKPIAMPELGITFENDGELIKFMTLMGSNSGAVEVLLRNAQIDISYVLDPDTNEATRDVDLTKYQEAMNRLIKEGKVNIGHINAVNEIWKVFEELHPELESTMRKTDNIPIGKIKARSITVNVDGKDVILTGGYAPISVNADFKSATSDSDYMPIDTNGVPSSTFVQRTNFTKERTGGVDKIDLDISTLTAYTNAAIDIIEMREALSNFRNIMLTPQAKNAVEEKAPGAYRNVILPWFNRTTRQVYTEYSNDLMDRYARVARKGVNTVLYSLNIASGLRQNLGLLQATRRVKKRDLVAASIESYLKPKAVASQVLGKSPFMQERYDTSIKDAHRSMDLLNTNFDWVTWTDDKINLLATFFAQYFQQRVDLATWSAAYTRQLKEGRSEQEAIAVADDVVMRTQGSMAASALSNLQAGTDLKKLFLTATSIPLINLNELGLEIRDNKDNLNKVKGLSGALTVLVAGPVLFEGYFQAAIDSIFGADDEEEDEEFKKEKRMAVQITGSTISTTAPVLGRFVESYIVYGSASSGPVSNVIGRGEAAGSGIKNLYRGVSLNDREKKALLDMSSFLTGSGVFTMTGRALQYYNLGKTEEEMAEERAIRRYQLEDLQNEID